MTVQRIGIIGGGQLAWMMAAAAQKLGLQLIIQTPSPDDPAVSIADQVIYAPIADAAATAKLAQCCDVITFENEFIDLDALRPLEEAGVCFRPRLDALAPLLDKYTQHQSLEQMGLPVPDYQLLEPDGTIPPCDFPVVLKARRHGYDGQGTFILKSREALIELWERLGRPSILLESFIPFERELAVMAARSLTGEVVVYPVVETQQINQVCRRVMAPAVLAPALEAEIIHAATTLLNSLEVVGIFGIEFFLTQDQRVLVNEIAPRTHNSGHYTLDACEVSQFEMQLRAVAGLPLPVPQLKTGGVVMVNLLGYETAYHDYQEKRARLSEIPGATLHWYGKAESRPGRKLAHITVLSEEPLDEAGGLAIAQPIEQLWYPS
ncbi:5-(carboxyamino)imidazole ribonucleotide synthase [Spirulina subsalsa FACHB-351]|uniref:N5-carboxyaminoimidazole ribonucleotide synthase n=1 Tax=Spirulina subsalsa FACHB-351 TaxID=234711 RepID=A0ABT3L1V1_9CYAN|nr:5-(carboxyamino)imidazole ribonucleotide synthase [Spirulina subsalsa]MCW6035471.1 5-(carboxyamino)imidazole ribonucleotide synthase [Spirulina subsalsa FACHB-351]